MMLGISLMAIWLIAQGLLPLSKGRLPQGATVLNVFAVGEDRLKCFREERVHRDRRSYGASAKRLQVKIVRRNI